MNYFEIFELPVAYNLDINLLTNDYFSLQRDPCCRVDLSLLNEAYSVLKNDIKRAEYFLNLKDIPTDEMSTALAMQMFEMRETYENSSTEEKIEFQNQTKGKIKNLILLLKKSEGDLEKFSEIFSELKFLNSFLKKERSDVYSRD